MSSASRTAAIPTRGRLEDTPLPRLLLDLQRARSSGFLILRQGSVEKRIQIREGSPTLAESNRARDGLIELLLQQEQIRPDQHEKALAMMQARHCKELTALLAVKAMGPKELLLALRDHVRRSLLECFAWFGGEFEFHTEEAPSQESQSLPLDLLALVQEGIAAHWRADQTLSSLGERVTRFPSPGPLFTQARKSLREDEPLRELLDALDGTVSTWTALRRAGSPLAFAGIWVLDAVGALAYADEAATGAGASAQADDHDDLEIEIVVSGASETVQRSAPAGPEARTRAVETAADQRESELVALRDEVLDKHARLAEISLYELLGVERDATAAQIKRAYIQAAKRMHPDALSRFGLDDVKRQANELFAEISKAHATLSDAEERRSYDASLEGHSSVDANQLAQAEALYRKGEVLLRAGNFLGALEFLQASVGLWPEEADYQSAYGWALHRKNPPESERAREHLEKALALNDKDAETHRRLGLVLKALGETQAAEAALAEARRLSASRS